MYSFYLICGINLSSHSFLQYIRKLLFSDLDKSSIEHVLRQLRKLPWSDCESYLLKCFMKVHKGKYGQIHLIASLTTGLSRYHDEFAVAVVDEVSFFHFSRFCFSCPLYRMILVSTRQYSLFQLYSGSLFHWSFHPAVCLCWFCNL